MISVRLKSVDREHWKRNRSSSGFAQQNILTHKSTSTEAGIYCSSQRCLGLNVFVEVPLLCKLNLWEISSLITCIRGTPQTGAW